MAQLLGLTREHFGGFVLVQSREWGGCQSGWRRVAGVQGFRVFIFSGPFEAHITPHLRFPTAVQRRPSDLASCLTFPGTVCFSRLAI